MDGAQSMSSWVEKTKVEVELGLEEDITTTPRDVKYIDILDEIESIWFDETQHDRLFVNKTVSTIFCHHLDTTANPYALTISLFENTRDFCMFKTTTLAFFMLKELAKWTELAHIKSVVNKEKLLTKELRCRVFRVTTGRAIAYFDMAVKVFDLNHDGNEYFLPFIRYDLEQQKYKEVAVTVAKLGLQDYFKMEEIIIPLLLQDKVNMLENFVVGKPELQKQVVQLLDNLCDRDSKIDQFIVKSGVEVVKRGHLNFKTLSKLAVRLMKLYGIQPSLCPNIMNARGFGALRFLLYKRYIEMSMGSGSWEEMVMSVVGNSTYLKEQLVEQLMCYNDLQEAVKWANTFAFQESQIPPAVLKARLKFEKQKIDKVGIITEDEDWDSETLTEEDMSAYYYNLTLPIENITMVDSKETLNHCSQRLSVPETVIGIDSEWRPSLVTETYGMSIMQLAVKEHIYLCDIATLSRILSKEDISHFMELVFCNPNTVKLGYGFDTDMLMLVKNFPYLKDVLAGIHRFVDLATLSKSVWDKDHVMLDECILVDDDFEGHGGCTTAATSTFTKSADKGLSELVRQCFGKPLCKKEQMSNWEKRPLRAEQIVYASLDAFVLLEIYDYIKHYCQDKNIQVELEPPTKITLSKKSRQDKKKERAAGSISREKKH